jgi:hypothetical protein
MDNQNISFWQILCLSLAAAITGVIIYFMLVVLMVTM